MSEVRPRYTLTVELSIDKGTLRRVLRPSFGEERRVDEPLADVGRSYVVGGRTGLAALQHVLDLGDERTLAEHLTGAQLVMAGHALFHALVGPEEGAWSQVKTALFRSDWAAPTNQPLRVRVVTSAEALAGMPWGITAWRGSYLRDYGWTFETSERLVPTDDLRLKLPTGIVLILPELTSGELDSQGHHDAMVELLEAHFHGSSQGKLFAVARTRVEVDRALKNVLPSIVYYYGHGAGGARPGLGVSETAGRDRTLWPAQDVALAIANSRAPVQIAYLNGCSTGAGGWQSVGRQLLPTVPVVLAHPTTAWTPGARRTALGWLGRVLAGQEPVSAAFHRETHQPMDGVGWLPPLTFTRHHSFVVEHSKTEFTRPREGLDLDRHAQREQAHSQVRQLALRPERRIQGFIALASPRNHPADVAKQLRTYIEDLDPRCDLHMTPPLPVRDTLRRGKHAEPTFADDLGHRLNFALGFDWHDKLSDVLAAKAPPRTGRRHRILWLDWQVLTDLPVKDDIAAWLSFCAGRLVRELPSGVDLVVTIAVEVPAPKVLPLKTALDQLVNDGAYRTDEARFTVLPVLGLPDFGEVLQFLEDAGCSGNLRVELAKALLDEPEVDYARLRERMDEGLRTTWQELKSKLSMRGPGSKDPEGL